MHSVELLSYFHCIEVRARNSPRHIHFIAPSLAYKKYDNVLYSIIASHGVATIDHGSISRVTGQRWLHSVIGSATLSSDTGRYSLHRLTNSRRTNCLSRLVLLRSCDISQLPRSEGQSVARGVGGRLASLLASRRLSRLRMRGQRGVRMRTSRGMQRRRV